VTPLESENFYFRCWCSTSWPKHCTCYI